MHVCNNHTFGDCQQIMPDHKSVYSVTKLSIDTVIFRAIAQHQKWKNYIK